MEKGETQSTIAVLGAGAIGVGVALYLQRDGHRVTLIDRDDPGLGCSFGNAALIQCASVLPVAAPGLLSQVPRMLLDPDQPLVIRWRHLPSLLPYLLRFARESTADRASANADALAKIIPDAYDAYQPLIQEAGLQHLVKKRGELQVFNSQASFEGAERGRRMRRERGVEVEELPVDAVREVEPALAPDIRWAARLPNSYQVRDPFSLVSGLAQHFVSRGGIVLKTSVLDVSPNERGFSVKLASGELHVDGVVVALGAFSAPIAKRLGSPTPLNSERGYHVTLPNPGVSLDHTVVSGNYRFALGPLNDGIRLAGTAELAKVGAPADFSRAERLIPMAEKVLPGLKVEGKSVWMGHRPSLPDSVPIISASPIHRNLWFAFGHGHSGLTLGGITGRIIADMVAGRRSNELYMAPYAIERFL